MEKWSHKSLDWLHQVRVQNHEHTRDKDPEEVARETVKDAGALIKALNLELIYPIKSQKSVACNWCNRQRSMVVAATDLTGVNSSYTGGEHGWTGDMPQARFGMTKVKKLGWKLPCRSPYVIEIRQSKSCGQ